MGLTLLETALPYRELSLLASASRRSKDPAYSIHKWWARRPAAVFRGLLLASALEADTTPEKFWQQYESDQPTLRGRTVLDPFSGGGTTLVEAARLGAHAVGYDIDPVAVEIAKQSLSLPTSEAFAQAADALLEALEPLAALYPEDGDGGEPLHYFYLPEVICPECESESVMYRSLVLARDLGKTGAVVRDAAITAFCPDCLEVHELSSEERSVLVCCGRRHPLDKSTFSDGRFRCPSCETPSTHRELKTGRQPRRLVGTEIRHEDYYRYIRSATDEDLQALDAARSRLQAATNLWIPDSQIKADRIDERPRSFGFKHQKELFTDRQLLVFGTAFAWLRSAELDAEVRRALRLALSNALTANNKMCSYATDYGRLAPLFSVRGYALPILSVELNPLSKRGGRGTIRACVRRVSRSLSESVRRYVWVRQTSKAEARDVRLNGNIGPAEVHCIPVGREGAKADICLFDPPYFDYINYSELSEFYRAWLDEPQLGGTPLHPTGGDRVKSFAIQFGECLQRIVDRLADGVPLAFTFHSNQAGGWESVGLALDEAELSVTAIWPVRSDIDMGFHSMAGNCEWDLVVVCRRSTECAPARLERTVGGWISSLKPMRIKNSDRDSMSHALKMVASRHGLPVS